MDQSELKELEGAIKEAFAAVDAKHASLEEKQKDINARLLDITQRFSGQVPGTGFAASGGVSELAELLMKSDGLQAFNKNNTPSFAVTIPARLLAKNTIVNAQGSGQPLVPSDRVPSRGIIHAPQQRLTIRGLFAAIKTESNMIERPQETAFTNNAAVQGGDASPTGSGEGALKAQSDMTFSLAQTPIITLAHYIIASRQIMSDAPLLQHHLESRLLWGLNLKEETQVLTGDGSAGGMTGITASAAAFNGGVTNATRLDTLARAAAQLAVGSYEPSGVILHPLDWLACQLEKNSNGDYVLGDPGAQTVPMVWGLPVVPTPSMTVGKFVVLDAARYGYLADREDATVRISENVNDAFLRNLIHVLCEKRTALVTELGGAAVYGNLTTVG